MSTKIAVGATVAEAFQTGLRRWPAVIRFFLLPAIISCLLMGGVMVGLVDFKAAHAASKIESIKEFEALLRVPLPAFFGAIMVAYLGVFLLFAGGAASYFRLIALDEDRPGLFQLRLDGPAWRVFWSILIIALIDMTIFAVGIIAAATITGQSAFGWLAPFFDLMRLAAENPDAELSPEQARAMFDGMKPFFIGCALAFIPMLYMRVKLSPFPAASAAENRLVLFGSFAMTFGHFWSIVFSFLLFGVALIALFLVFGLGIGTLQGVGAMIANADAMRFLGYAIVAVAIALRIALQVVVAGSQLALPAIIYRKLKA